MVIELKMQVEAMEMEHFDSLRENKSKVQKVLEDIEDSESSIHEQMADARQSAVFQKTSYPFDHGPSLTEITFPSFRDSTTDFNCPEFLGEVVPMEKITKPVREEENESRDREDSDKPTEVFTEANDPKRIQIVYSYISDLSCTKDNHVLVCGTYRMRKSYNISKLDFEGREIQTVPTDYQAKFITEGSDGAVYYTAIDNQGVKRTRNGITETIVKDDLWRPNGLACKSSGDIIVAEHSETPAMGRLRIYSCDGKIKETIAPCTSRLDAILKKPTFVCENVNGDICTSDEGYQNVVVFASTGGPRFQYKGKTDSPTLKSFNPRGLATDCLGNILVADYFNHTVHVIDSEGKFLQYILANKISFPYALSIDYENRLLIGQFTDARI